MKRRLRQELRLLRLCAGLSCCACAVVALAAFRQSGASQKFAEINVERINVVDANGTLRMVISNKDRMHPGIIDGKTINRPRPVAGMLFFNDEGDEVGGLTFTGQEKEGQRAANGMIAFDQLKQDQIVALMYQEGKARSAGLHVWDRPETRLSELIDKLNAANALQDPAAREAALKAVRASAPPAPRRVFVGRSGDRAATVSLADAKGQVRLTLSVNADGEASINFLDADGKVVQRLPAPGK
jgi:hypothetical protein